jgi:hypothetical protein
VKAEVHHSRFGSKQIATGRSSLFLEKRRNEEKAFFIIPLSTICEVSGSAASDIEAGISPPARW